MNDFSAVIGHCMPKHLFSVYYFHTEKRGMCTSSNKRNGTIGSYAGSISGYRSNHFNSPVSGMLLFL